MKKRYDGILLCSDFDHTLSSCTHKWIEGGAIIDSVPQSNIEAIKEFVACGGTFVIVSGRNPDEICTLYDYFPFEDLFVASNGTAIYSASEQRAVKSWFLDDGFVDVMRFLNKNEPSFAYFRITDNDFKFRHWHAGDDIESVIASAKYPAYKAIIQPAAYDPRLVPEFKRTIVRRIIDEFSDRYKIDMSSDYTLEVCALGSGKGEAIESLIPMLNRSFDRVVCVGDGQNDVGMIKFADIGYAVGNAVDEVKRVADRITVTSDKGAIAQIISEL